MNASMFCLLSVWLVAVSGELGPFNLTMEQLEQMPFGALAKEYTFVDQIEIVFWAEKMRMNRVFNQTTADVEITSAISDALDDAYRTVESGEAEQDSPSSTAETTMTATTMTSRISKYEFRPQVIDYNYSEWQM